MSPAIFPEDTDNWLTISFDETIVYFDGTYLRIDLTIDWQMNAVFYEYHFGNVGGSTIWRLCKNQHRTAEFGDVHVHIAESTIVPASNVDLDRVLDCIRSRQIPGVD